MTTTNFDKVADIYGKTTGNLMRYYIEKATFLSVLKDVRGKSVLDLACGEGNYTRTIKRQGAAFVLGVDISKKMIAQARLEEEEYFLDIEYIVRDVRKLEQFSLFDIATAVYLFPYAQTEQAFVEMAQAIYTNLKPNGRLITITNHPDLTMERLAAPKKYNIWMELEGPIRDGARIMVTYPHIQDGHPIEILNYHWSKETFERLLKKVGFQRIKWHPMIVLAEGIEKYGKSYWEEYLKTPHIIVLECYK
jgi:toxoflavin synthase